MSAAVLRELADRVERASGLDRHIDGLIWQSIEPQHDYVMFGEVSQVLYRRDPHDSGAFDAPPPFTASIDAAMTLVLVEEWTLNLEQWPSPMVAVNREYSGNWPWGRDAWRATLTHDWGAFGQVSVISATPALALTAAALRARAHLIEKERGQ
jgi:hypothetical protein